MNCQSCKAVIPELLFDPASHTAAKAHLDACAACQQEFAAFEATFALLDAWQAPEPSPYFDQKLAVRLREEQAMPAANWLERLQARLLFNTGRQFRPALMGAMALALLVGGGTFAGVTGLPLHPQKAQISATVDDLQILDKNAQALQQMDQLLQDDAADDSATPPRT